MRWLSLCRVVSDAGLRNLTYRAVTPEAGVTHGLVTRHFGTHEASIAAALRYSLDNSISGITSEPASDGSSCCSASSRSWSPIRRKRRCSSTN